MEHKCFLSRNILDNKLAVQSKCCWLTFLHGALFLRLDLYKTDFYHLITNDHGVDDDDNDKVDDDDGIHGCHLTLEMTGLFFKL